MLIDIDKARTVLGPPVHIGSDVTRENPPVDGGSTAVYIRGDEFTDGSIRLIFSVPGDDVTHIERRASGVWNSTELELSPASLRLGHGVTLSGGGGYLEVHATADDRTSMSLLTPFDAGAGSYDPRALLLAPVETRAVLQPFDSAEWLTDAHRGGSVTNSLSFLTGLYLKVGSVGATEPVRVMIHSGVAPDDVMFFERWFPPSFFTADTEVRIDFPAGISYKPGGYGSLFVDSAAPFSLLAMTSDGPPWIAIDSQEAIEEPVFTMPTGFDRLLADSFGDMVTDSSGNLIASGGAL